MKPDQSDLQAEESRFVPAALAAGVAGASFAFAPLGQYTLPLALGVGGLALLAPDVVSTRSRARIGAFTIAALMACVLSIVVGMIGYAGASDFPGFEINLEGLSSNSNDAFED